MKQCNLLNFSIDFVIVITFIRVIFGFVSYSYEDDKNAILLSFYYFKYFVVFITNFFNSVQVVD